jgi:transcription initiation factor TFIID subunit TAF12
MSSLRVCARACLHFGSCGMLGSRKEVKRRAKDQTEIGRVVTIRTICELLMRMSRCLICETPQQQQHQQQQQQQQQQFDAEHQRDNSGGSSRSNGLFGFLTSSANGTDVVLANGAHYASTVPLSRMPTSSSSSSLSTLSTQERAASAGAVADAVSPSKEFSISVHHL